MALKLVYGDIALGAAEDAAIAVTDAESFSTPTSLPFGVDTGAISTLEHNGWGLSHDYKAKDTQPFALWSDSISNAEGVFTTPPVITIEFDEQYTSTGLTFRFSPDAEEYCSEIGVAWYRNGVILDAGTYYPNAGQYAAENTVEAFNKIVITLKKTHLPNRRAKLEYIGIGIIREIGGRELKNASFIHEINLISDAIPINVLDGSFHSESDVDYIFQKKQPVSAYDGDRLIGTYYIESGERTGRRDYNISCQDAIGTLELDTFNGAIWLEDTPLAEAVDAVIGGAFVVVISAELANVKLRGYIPKCKKREALQHIAFAAGACIDTAGTEKIKMFQQPTGTGAEIAKADTYIGGKVTTKDTVTAVNVTAYNRITASAKEDIDEVIKFDGVEYVFRPKVFTAENPNVTSGTLPNVLEYSSCYLINSDNAQARADAILAYHMRRDTYSAKHVLNGQTTGDRVNVHLPWNESQGANIVKMKISISGINASETDFLLD